MFIRALRTESVASCDRRAFGECALRRDSVGASVVARFLCTRINWMVAESVYPRCDIVERFVRRAVVAAWFETVSVSHGRVRAEHHVVFAKCGEALRCAAGGRPCLATCMVDQSSVARPLDATVGRGMYASHSVSELRTECARAAAPTAPTAAGSWCRALDETDCAIRTLGPRDARAH